MTDVFICNTPDGGEIDIVGGAVTLNGGIESAVYLSLFGGNSDDAGGQDRSLEFWGNIGEQQNEQQRSRTQHLLESIPPSSSNLRRIEDAVRADLAWMGGQSPRLRPRRPGRAASLHRPYGAEDHGDVPARRPLRRGALTTAR